VRISVSAAAPSYFRRRWLRFAVCFGGGVSSGTRVVAAHPCKLPLVPLRLRRFSLQFEQQIHNGEGCPASLGVKFREPARICVRWRRREAGINSGCAARSACKIPWLSPVSGGGVVPGEQTGEGIVMSCLIGTSMTRIGVGSCRGTGSAFDCCSSVDCLVTQSTTAPLKPSVQTKFVLDAMSEAADKESA
jgi:hypothetical protein